MHARFLRFAQQLKPSFNIYEKLDAAPERVRIYPADSISHVTLC